MQDTTHRRLTRRLFPHSAAALLLAVSTPCGAADTTKEKREAQQILEQAGRSDGLLVHVGCGDGRLTAALGAESSFLVQGIDTDPARVTAARHRIAPSGVYGRVSVAQWDGRRLPYADNLANVVVSRDEGRGAREETLRVLCPGGVALISEARGQKSEVSRERVTIGGRSWVRVVKPWPKEIDEWTHYLHDADNNAVAHDTRVGPPRSLQWIESPRWARHHDRMASMSALVTAGGRLFYIFDEGPTSSIVLPSKWSLIARDAFNGLVLWKKPIPEWHTRLWPLKSGPAQLPRRLVTTRDTVFATLGVDVPVTALDARTGDVVRTYGQTKGTEEILVSDGVLFVVANPALETEKYRDPGAVRKPWWSGETVQVMAIRAASGETLWQAEGRVVPLTLTVDEKRVFFHDGTRAVCLDRTNGSTRWRSDPLPVVERIMSFFAPTMLVQDGVVLFAGGEESGLVKSTGGATKLDTLTALDAATGKTLWTAEHLPSGYSSPEDVFVIDGVVWYGGTSNGRLPGAVIGRDLKTGEVRASYDSADVQTYWFHHRCHRGKATDRYMMVSRTGIEFIDPKTGHWDINHWTRGGCLYGIMPANGFVYTPPHACACYPESKMFGFAALASQRSEARDQKSEGRLERGPAFAEVRSQRSEALAGAVRRLREEDWATYRHDTTRSGSAGADVPAKLAEKWKVEIGGRLSAVTIAEGRVFVADIDRHTIMAVDAAAGKRLWSYVTGGRVDSPPTIHSGTAIFGCADGWVYCLRARDGELVWRFRAAPADSRIISFGQLESRWPVHGSVLVQDGVVYALAGRSLFLDGGMHLCRLDAVSGKLLSEEVLDERDPETGKNMQTHVKRLTMPVALPDVLSSDGRHVYMRSQVFDMQGKRLDIAPHAEKLGAHASVQEGETKHLFASAGFLDGEWFHRAYWVYGRSFEGGWNSYYLAGKKVPAGKILVCDDEQVYGFGREPKCFRWTTPMEFHLFASPKEATTPKAARRGEQGSIIRVNKRGILNPAKSALAVAAWVRSEQPNGVVVARGGSILGYALYLKGGKPCFSIRAESKKGDVVAKEKIVGDWVHLAGVLTADTKLRVYVDGLLAGTADAPSLIPRDPADAMQIGADEGSLVGSYRDGAPFKGIIDDVRVYHGSLTDADIRSLATGGGSPGQAKLVLHYTFDKGKATDASGRKNRGKIVGAVSAPGKLGKGLRFSGRLPDEKPASPAFTWSVKTPILVRGMLVAGKTLFIAGPDDLLDEPETLRSLDQPATREKMERQAAALAGRTGGVLHAVSVADGKTLSELRLETIPVWDGLAAARSSLYVAGADGTLRCYKAK